MPLISLWDTNPDAISQLTVEQVVGTAGDGNLKDDNDCSSELRQFLSQVPSHRLFSYIDQCLTSSFQRSGLVLQDLVNELGRRLDYEVTNGRYLGRVNAIGHDGIWKAPDGYHLVIEVKTTDAYRISLDTVAKYRSNLLSQNIIDQPSSILIVVGREDTGDLEAQVRGSKHAWDIRLISTDALANLVQLKESTEGPETVKKIRSLLAPFEYTKLDNIIDVMFATATDVGTATEGEAVAGPEGNVDSEDLEHKTSKSRYQFTDSATLQRKREEIIGAVSKHEGTKLIQKTRALYWDAAHETRVVCTVSKRYDRKDPYWYAYHPQWQEFLKDGMKSFFVLACMDLNTAFVIPYRVLEAQLKNLNVTIRTGARESYWHIKIIEPVTGKYALHLPKLSDSMPLDEYRLPEITPLSETNS